MHMFSISLDILFAKINGSRVDKHTLKNYLCEFDTQNNFIYHEYDIWSRPPDSCNLDRKKTESCQLRNVLSLKRSMWNRTMRNLAILCVGWSRVSSPWKPLGKIYTKYWQTKKNNIVVILNSYIIYIKSKGIYQPENF